MKDKKIDRLQMLLRQVEMPQTPEGFTEEVMHETGSLQGGQAWANKRLKEVLQSGRLAEPPTNFAYMVDLGIKQSKSQVVKPVITTGVWIAIGLFLVVCIVVALAFPTEDTRIETDFYLTWVTGHVVSWMSLFHEAFLYSEVIVLAAGTLLVLDSMLRRAAGLPKHINS
jgi:hypothetical protein